MNAKCARWKSGPWYAFSSTERISLTQAFNRLQRTDIRAKWSHMPSRSRRSRTSSNNLAMHRLRRARTWRRQPMPRPNWRLRNQAGSNKKRRWIKRSQISMHGEGLASRTLFSLFIFVAGARIWLLRMHFCTSIWTVSVPKLRGFVRLRIPLRRAPTAMAMLAATWIRSCPSCVL